jgi:predicted nucleic acid-binding Zn ribbon protein
MSDPPVKECPECGKEVRRLIFGGTGIIFKGSGFYVTDKGKGSGGRPAEKAKPAGSSPEGGAVKADAGSKQPSGESASKNSEAGE